MKYFKDKASNLVIELLDNQDANYPLAKVVVADIGWEVGDEAIFDLRIFEPCEKPNLGSLQSTQTGKPIPNYTKDAELRLECLKLAIQTNSVYPVIKAQEYYEWVNQKQIYAKYEQDESNTYASQ